MPNPSPGRLFFFVSVLLCFVASAPAEICIDGKFLGNTPATLKFSTGPHEIVLKSAGLPD